MKYCIDTSSLLDGARRWYPREVFPGLWKQMEALVESGLLISSEEVLRELERKDDELATWAKQRKAMFLPLSDGVQARAKEILDEFPRLVDGRTGKSFADPFVIATAMETDTTVVTGEKPTGSRTRPKMPDVCDRFDVPWMGLIDMIREEGWSF